MAGTSNLETLSQNAIAMIDEIYGITKPLLKLVNDDGVYSKFSQKVKSISCTANIIAKYATLLRVSFQAQLYKNDRIHNRAGKTLF